MNYESPVCGMTGAYGWKRAAGYLFEQRGEVLYPCSQWEHRMMLHRSVRLKAGSL